MHDQTSDVTKQYWTSSDLIHEFSLTWSSSSTREISISRASWKSVFAHLKINNEREMRTMEKYSIFYGLLIWRRKVLMVIKARKKTIFMDSLLVSVWESESMKRLNFLSIFFCSFFGSPLVTFAFSVLLFRANLHIDPNSYWWHSSSLVTEMSNVCCVTLKLMNMQRVDSQMIHLQIIPTNMVGCLLPKQKVD